MTRNRSLVLFGLVLVAIVATLTAATNYVQPGDQLTMTWATTSPSAGDAVVKGTDKAHGAIVGVALTGGGTAGENVAVATRGVFKLPVIASSTIGSMAVGDYVYTTMGGVEVCTTALSNLNTGIKFGQLLEAITATTTHGVSNTVKIMVLQPGHL
jgi:predicted RecA/RadA family phage recombinase